MVTSQRLSADCYEKWEAAALDFARLWEELQIVERGMDDAEIEALGAASGETSDAKRTLEYRRILEWQLCTRRRRPAMRIR